ncbi:unnamed protein product [Bursaphelenchus okinawaensis]|uniref:Uncharacterized protein n=1 Tax=Bursaphelenchus okinawaensis TaxID=465554 RepID=A0A811KAQ9_9BILA|nr:unnamed protein product [Bursaphelenchus okinawaensis]CAG9099598.1 unnamed protein product [Bursaphelenchus okinawaensis]
MELNTLVLEYFRIYDEFLTLNELNYALGTAENTMVDAIRACTGLFRVRISQSTVDIILDPIERYAENACLVQATEKAISRKVKFELQQLCRLRDVLGPGGYAKITTHAVQQALMLDSEMKAEDVINYLNNLFTAFYEFAPVVDNVAVLRITKLQIPPFTKEERLIRQALKASRQYASNFQPNPHGIRVQLIRIGDFRRPLLVKQINLECENQLKAIIRKSHGYIKELKTNPIYLPRENYCCLLINEHDKVPVRRVQILRPYFRKVLCMDVDSGEFKKAYSDELFDAPPDFLAIPRMVEPFVFHINKRGRLDCMQKSWTGYFGPQSENETQIIQRIFDAAFNPNFQSPVECIGSRNRNLSSTMISGVTGKRIRSFNCIIIVSSPTELETDDLLFPLAKAGTLIIRSADQKKEQYPEKLVEDYANYKNEFLNCLKVQPVKI